MNKLMKKQKKNNKGFSLVELIVVIAIMAVLVGVIAPQFLGYVQRSQRSADVTNAQSIASAIQADVADGNITIPDTGTTTAVVTDAITAITTNPVVKSSDTLTFAYTLDSNGTVQVGIGTAEGITVLLYPDPAGYAD